MGYVHHCVFCGWHREAASAAMLDPVCETCGAGLRAERAELWSPPPPPEEEARRRKPSLGMDVSGLFAVLVAGPFLLPFFGLQMSDFLFAVPLVVLFFATARTLEAARRDDAERGVWKILALSTGLASTACAIAVVAAALNKPTTLAFYLGSTASAALLVAAWKVARIRVANMRAAGLLDAAVPAVVIGALAAHFVAMPGIRFGDPLLTIVFLVDLSALLLAAIAATAGHRTRDWWLVVALGAATAGDGLVCAAAAGRIGDAPALTALLWTAAGIGLVLAAHPGPRSDASASHAAVALTGRWVATRVILPLVAVLAFPALGLVLWALGSLDLWAVGYFGTVFGIVVVLVFGRQASLLVDHHRAVTRERRMREEAVRRSEELEALTGLATTMTQTLEEAPITEQALNVLHLAARASSSALHSWRADGTAEIRAAAGEWQSERPFAGTPVKKDDPRWVRRRGGRQIVRLRLHARGSDIGAVTLVRPSSDPLDEHDLDLLGLLVDQLAMALQNARDYRDRLEQAVRDPLTGVYNRRFFFEALEKEVLRAERYGSEMSVVMFDVDDFKLINDTHGHSVGDDVLRRIGEIVEQLIRPVDSFARIGGEEFALLLPETRQLDALLVAERIRTALSRHEMLPDRRVTVSAGIASCPHDATTVHELQRRADAAMYWAKRNGKDLSAVASEVSSAEEGGDREGVLAHLYALVSTIDARALHTRDHSENVAAYAVALGQALGLDRDRIVRLRRAALLHDLGKVVVPESILQKPGKLTDEEFGEIETHSVTGARMLEHAGLVEEASWVRHHHERIDGTGYPDGLAGDEIPFEARIVFVADAFEAMTSDRPYRAGMSPDVALAELRRCAGTQFEPRIVETLERLVSSGELAVLALREDSVESAASRS